MLVIRKEQMLTLEQAVIHNFENRMLDHLEKFFPIHCKILGVEQVYKVIRLGLERAERYDFISERNVHLYVGLMFMLGSYFDRDPQLPWATKILSDENIANPNTRANRLYGRAMTFLNEAAGKDNQYLERALRNAHKLSINALSRSGEDKKISFGDYMLKLLYAFFPEKYEAVSEANIRRLIRHGYQIAKSYNLTSETANATYISLMFMLGSGFDKDPQYPWATTVLNDASLVEPNKKGDQLYQLAKAHLEKWLASQ